MLEEYFINLSIYDVKLKCETLKILVLKDNILKLNGTRWLVSAIRNNSFPNLERLNLQSIFIIL